MSRHTPTLCKGTVALQSRRNEMLRSDQRVPVTRPPPRSGRRVRRHGHPAGIAAKPNACGGRPLKAHCGLNRICPEADSRGTTFREHPGFRPKGTPYTASIHPRLGAVQRFCHSSSWTSRVQVTCAIIISWDGSLRVEDETPWPELQRPHQEHPNAPSRSKRRPIAPRCRRWLAPISQTRILHQPARGRTR